MQSEPKSAHLLCKISLFFQRDQKKKYFCNSNNEKMEIDRQKIAEHINLPVMRLVGSVADELHRECYVVGGHDK